MGKAQHNFFRESEAAQFQTGNRAVPREELSQHKEAQSAWLSLNGTVYDVTAYIKYHPGGRLILKGCGTECDELFSIPAETQTSTTRGSMGKCCCNDTKWAT